MSTPPGSRTESDYRRLRAYEGLLVWIAVVATVLIVATPAVVVMTASLRSAVRSIGSTP